VKEKNVLDILRDLLDEIENLPESEILSPKDEPVEKGEQKLGTEPASPLIQRIYTFRSKLHRQLVFNARIRNFKAFLNFHTLYSIVDSLLWWQLKEEFNQHDSEYSIGIRDGFVVVKFLAKKEPEESGTICVLKLQSLKDRRKKDANGVEDKKEENIEEFNFEDYPEDSLDSFFNDNFDPNKFH